MHAGEIVGIAGLQADGIAGELCSEDERPVEVVLAYVRPTYRRRRCGTALLHELERASVGELSLAGEDQPGGCAG